MKIVLEITLDKDVTENGKKAIEEEIIEWITREYEQDVTAIYILLGVEE